jgi:phosphoribosylaminoimidazole-succinocarboxamide synthase
MDVITQTELEGLTRIHQGKVRDIYEVDAETLLLVATDRVSAFDRILGTGIPGKGAVLTQTSVFWFQTLKDTAPNHLLAHRAEDMPGAAGQAARKLGGRAVLVRKATVVPVECIVRGYLAGSVQKAYERDGAIQGIELPPGIPIGGQLPQPIFTPTTKAAQGHDEPITYAQLEDSVGADVADQLRRLSLEVFRRAATRCAEAGLILCDTKFEFGHLPDGTLILVDEVLTPDSSRFFKASEHQPGRPPVPWDKQLVRDYLNAHPELKEGEAAPVLPDDVVTETAARYAEVYRLLSGRELGEATSEATG